MTFIVGLRLLLDMATVYNTENSCTGYGKSKETTESCKKQSVAQRLSLYGTGKVYRRYLPVLE